MTAKEYLGQLWRLDRKVDSLKDEKLRLEERAKGMAGSSDQERVQTSPSKALEDTWAKIAQISLDIDSNINEAARLYKEARGWIDKLDNHTYSSILRMRHLNFRSWEYIGENQGYSPRHARRLNGWALEELDKIMSFYVQE